MVIGLYFIDPNSKNGSDLDGIQWGADGLSCWWLVVRRDGRLREYAKLGLYIWFLIWLIVVWLL
jgi:hypothetical protein